jgi:hypothetical protein
MAPVHGKLSAVPVAPPPDLKVFRPQSPFVALGLAVNHLMTKPAFANLRFGDFKRFYKDGSVRPARLRVNHFVAQHLRRQNGDAPPVGQSMPRRSTGYGSRF